jgi:predicted regulator of Ras-like GTPase activity (Roadblock/LC7/MglB family)
MLYQVNQRGAQGKATFGVEKYAADHDRMLSAGQQTSPTLSECQLLKITTTVADHPVYIFQIDAGLVVLAAVSICNDALLGPGHRLSVQFREDIYKGIWEHV